MASSTCAEWRGGPPVNELFSPGLGTTLIEQSAKSEGGGAERPCEAEGITSHIVLRLPHGPEADASTSHASLVYPPHAEPVQGSPQWPDNPYR